MKLSYNNTMIILKNNAIFIADSHFNSSREELYHLLIRIKNNDIDTNQIFLMGDIFDFLSDEIDYFKSINKNIINLINKLSLNIEIIYLEGNHDFNLSNIFPNLCVVSRKMQPLKIIHDNINIAIAHGDIFTPLGYNIYTSIIRNHYFLLCLNSIDINFWLSKRIELRLKNKSICHKQKNFSNFIQNRVASFNIDLVIEGHYHQGLIDDKYINVPSFACDKRYIKYYNNKFYFET